MTEFEQYFSCDNLAKCVEALLDGHFDVIAERPRISTGADRIELDLFCRDQEKHLDAISRKVIESRYTFNPFLERHIPKPESQELRTISIASIRDSIVQRALYQYLYPVIDAKLSPSVFGYRKGISAHDAIRLIRNHFTDGRVFVFDADIQQFFDRVNHDILLEMVSALPVDTRAATLIRRFLKTGKIPPAQVEEQRIRKGKQIKYVPEPRTIGVPQGGVLSGLLSNLYLSQFDAVVREQFPGLVRYADDFLVCCESEQQCRQVHELVESELTSIKLALHPKKTTECVHAGKGVSFLGFHISIQGLRVRTRNIQKFKARIRDVLGKHEPRKTPAQTLRSLVWKLTFKIRGPNEEQLRKLAERGKLVQRCRRSWIGYFRIVDDLSQIRSLDRWIRGQVSAFMWEKHRIRVRLTHMQNAGLPSLISSLWNARSNKQVREQ